MALSAAGSPLVAGGGRAQEKGNMKTMEVEVVRAFFYKGEPTKVGTKIEVPAIFGAELIAAKKAKAVTADEAKPMADPPKGDGGKGGKGK